MGTVGDSPESGKPIVSESAKEWIEKVRSTLPTGLPGPPDNKNAGNLTPESSDLSQRPQWPTPLPLREIETPEDFPIGHLPEIIYNAVDEAQRIVQAPLALVAGSALSAISAAVQGLITVYRDQILFGPSALFVLNVADSGERKSTCDKMFTRSLLAWQRDQREAYRPIEAEHEAAEKKWADEEEGLRRGLRAMAKEGATNPHDKTLFNHALTKPTAPRKPTLLRMDDTPEALAVALSEWPCAAVISAEAGIIFGGHGMNPDSVMRALSQFNIFWDGGLVQRKRTSTNTSVDIEGMRVTVGLMVQPAVLKAFLDKTKGMARGIGFFARFLFSHPTSTQGSRPYREPADGTPHLDAFNARVRQLLDIPLSVDLNGTLTTSPLYLSHEAKVKWTMFYNDIEERLAPEEEFYDVRDVASKTAENAVRVAANFHVFRGVPADCIGLDDMERGCAIAEFYLDEARRYSKVVAVPKNVENAETLEAFLIRECLRQKTLVLKKNVILKRGPYALRKDKLALDNALELLAEHHHIQTALDGVGANTSVKIFLNPLMLSALDRVRLV